jgi:hypothetical protein
MTEHVKVYAGHTITFDPQTFAFTIAGPAFPDRTRKETAASLHGAKQQIDEGIKKLAAEKRAASKVAIPVLTEAGTQVTCTGINARTGKMNGVGEADSVYPMVPWIAAGLAEMLALGRRLTAIKRQLEPYRAHASRGYGSIRVDTYAGAVEALEAELAEKRAKAIAATPKPAEAA